MCQVLQCVGAWLQVLLIGVSTTVNTGKHKLRGGSIQVHNYRGVNQLWELGPYLSPLTALGALGYWDIGC